MVFHLGVLWRLNELGILSRLERVSSVSGGSITAAMLGPKWRWLNFSDGIARSLVAEVIDPVRAFAHETVNVGAVLAGLFLPGSISDKVAKPIADTYLAMPRCRTCPTIRRDSTTTPPTCRPACCGASPSPTCATTRSAKSGTLSGLFHK
jgi:hypothetical protein